MKEPSASESARRFSDAHDAIDYFRTAYHTQQPLWLVPPPGAPDDVHLQRIGHRVRSQVWSSRGLVAATRDFLWRNWQRRIKRT
jgi:hypothetical protein